MRESCSGLKQHHGNGRLLGIKAGPIPLDALLVSVLAQWLFIALLVIYLFTNDGSS